MDGVGDPGSAAAVLEAVRARLRDVRRAVANAAARERRCDRVTGASPFRQRVALATYVLADGSVSAAAACLGGPLARRSEGGRDAAEQQRDQRILAWYDNLSDDEAAALMQPTTAWACSA